MTSPSLPLSADLSPADLVAFVRLRSRALAARLTARTLALAVMLVLTVGTSLSIVTTTKHNWWQLHFSELGTFDDFSGHVFNSTLIAGGLIITAFAVRVRIDLLSLTVMRGVRPSRILTICMVLVGLNMSGVGLVPLNTIGFLHDRLASGIMLSFLGLLVIVVVRHRHGTALLLGATIGIAAGLGVAIALFLTGILNLAALEIIGFTLIFVWVGVFTACLEKGMAKARRSETDPAAHETQPEVASWSAPQTLSAASRVAAPASPCAPGTVSSTAPVTWPRPCTVDVQSTTAGVPSGGATATWTWDAGTLGLPSCSEEYRARSERDAGSAFAEELVSV